MLFWVGTGKDQGGQTGGGSKQIEIHEILSKATSKKSLATKQPRKDTALRNNPVDKLRQRKMR